MIIFLGVIVIIALYFIIIMVRDGNRFVEVNYVVDSEKIKKDYTFVLLADLHNKSYGKENQKLIEAIHKIDPDSIMIAGDMLVGKPDSDFTVAATLIEKLSEKYPIFYGVGNHEYRLKLYPETYGTKWEDYFSRLKEVEVFPLSNLSVILEEIGIRVTGIEIEKEYYQRFVNIKNNFFACQFVSPKSKVQDSENVKDIRKEMTTEYMESLIGESKDDFYEILLAHNPEHFEAYAGWGANLVLSGHVHGGIMKIPFWGGVISPSFRIFPKYDGGIFKIRQSIMILSRGLGMHTLPIRIWNPGELIVVKLTNSHK